MYQTEPGPVVAERADRVPMSSLDELAPMRFAHTQRLSFQSSLALGLAYLRP